MNVTLRQLRAFVAVADSASFTQAAEQLHVTRPALSGLIAELESSLGVRVFHRSTRRVLLSEVGADFLPVATRILQDLEQALSAIRDLKALRTGTVRVGASQLIAATLMPEVIGAFAKQHAQVELQLVDSVPDDILPKVRSGEVDLAVGGERDECPDIEAHRLFEAPSVAVLPVDHPLASSRRAIGWKELSNYPLILQSGQYRRLLNASLLASGGPELRPRFEVAYITTVISLVSATGAVSTCPLFAKSLVEQQGLIIRPLHSPRIARGIYLFTRKDRVFSPATQAFANFLIAHTAQLKGGNR